MNVFITWSLKWSVLTVAVCLSLVAACGDADTYRIRTSPWDAAEPRTNWEGTLVELVRVTTWFAWQIGGFRRNERGSQDVQFRGMQTGGMFGWTGVWKRFAFTLGAGATYTHGRVKVAGQSVNDQEWNPWLKLGLGVAFGGVGAPALTE